MSRFVLDASVTTAWLLDDEDNPRASVALRRVTEESALVPQLWHVEVRSSLLAAERRGRLRTGEIEDYVRRIGDLPVRTDTAPDLDGAFVLARAHRLSIYDALYLELALRADAPLATLDRALARAAAAEGRPLVEPVDGQ